MTTLRWTRDNAFADHDRNFVARGQGEYEVPDDAVDDYLDHPSGGWERTDADSEADSEAESEAESGSGSGADGGDADPESETEADADAEADADTGAFDADEFVDRTPMSTVVDDIEAGEADDHLEAVGEAANRQGVRAAVAARRDELDDASDAGE